MTITKDIANFLIANCPHLDATKNIKVGGLVWPHDMRSAASKLYPMIYIQELNGPRDVNFIGSGGKYKNTVETIKINVCGDQSDMVVGGAMARTLRDILDCATIEPRIANVSLVSGAVSVGRDSENFPWHSFNVDVARCQRKMPIFRGSSNAFAVSEAFALAQTKVDQYVTECVFLSGSDTDFFILPTDFMLPIFQSKSAVQVASSWSLAGTTQVTIDGVLESYDFHTSTSNSASGLWYVTT